MSSPVAISLAAEHIASIGSFPISNSLVASWVAMMVMIAGAVMVRLRLTTIPRGMQSIAEFAIEEVLNLFTSVIGDAGRALKLFPLLATFFFFILTTNWMGILPGFGSIGFNEMHEGKQVFVPVLRSVHADINMTLAVAVISVIATQVYGIKANGLRYLKKYINLSNPILFGVGILEIVSEGAKVLSFSFRLFGNVFAGEVLLTIVGIIVAYVAPLPFYILELFVGFIQALVFTMLTLVFLSIATSHQEH